MGSMPVTSAPHTASSSSSPESAEAARRALGKRLKEDIARLSSEATSLKAELDTAAARLPCDTHPAAPVGPESAARVAYVHGSPRAFSFPPRDHLTLATQLGILDVSSPASFAGSGFAMLRGDGVRLEMALISWALARASAAGFLPCAPPDLVKTEFVEACGFNPRDSADGGASQVYRLANDDLCLIGTAEIPLAAQHAGSILEPRALPALYSGVTHCFRREAGAHGQRDKGLYRLHQFSKVELFAFVNPWGQPAPVLPDIPTRVAVQGAGAALTSLHASDAALQALVNLQVDMYAELGLHFRVLDMPTEELGASAARKFDVEAWMPCRTSSSGSAASARGAFGEISSASACSDYQARRLGVRVKVGAGDNRALHTLNATACAVPRVMLALLETHQQQDGSVTLPPALHPFMGGTSVLRPRNSAAAE